MKAPRWLPWQSHGVLPLLGILMLWSLLEAVRGGLYAVYLPQLRKEDLGLAVGFAYTAHYLSDSLSRSLGGYLVQRWGLGWVGLLGVGVALVVVGVAQTTQTPWVLLGISVLWGLSLSGILPGLMTFSSRIAVKGREGRALAFTQIFTSPFIGLGFFGTNFLIESNKEIITEVYMVALVIAALSALPVLLYKLHIKLPDQEFYPWKRLMLVVPAAFMQTFGLGLFTLIIAPYAQSLGIDTLGLLVIVAVGAVISIAATGFFGRMADRNGPRTVLIGGALLLATTMFLITLKLGFWPFLAVAILGGVGMGMFGPSWNALVLRQLPQRNREAVWGTLMMIEGLGMATAPAVGKVLDHYSPTAPFVFGGLIWLGLAVFYFMALRRLSWKQNDTQA